MRGGCMSKIGTGIKFFAALLAVFSLLSPQQAAAVGETTSQFGTSTNDISDYSASDSTGVYTVGHTSGSFSGYTNAGEDDAFLVKHDLRGNPLWTRQFGAQYTERAYTIATYNGAIYVGGGLYPEGFIRKYDQNGNEQWTRTYNYNNAQLTYIRGIAFDNDAMYIAAQTTGTAPGETHVGSDSSYDIVVEKYDLAGNRLWSKQLGTVDNDSLEGLAINSSDVYIAGFVSSALPGQVHSGFFDAYAAKYSKDGTLSWIRQFGTSTGDFAEGISADDSGTYVVGVTNGSLDSQAYRGDYDGYVKKISPSGADLWTKQFGTTASDDARAVTVNSNAIYVGGYMGAEASVDVFGANGNQVNSYRYTTPAGSALNALDASITGITVSNGTIYASGIVGTSFAGQVSKGEMDSFLIAQRINGNPILPIPPAVCNLVPLLCS